MPFLFFLFSSFFFRTRFEFEADVTGGLEHPGIVQVYGLGHLPDGRPFYAMRFIKGNNLKEAIARFHQAESQSGRDPGTGSWLPDPAPGSRPDWLSAWWNL